METTYKINLGNGIKIITHTELRALNSLEKDYLFKNAKQCSNINIDTKLNTENIINCGVVLMELENKGTE